MQFELTFIFSLLWLTRPVRLEIIWAVNCGGPGLIDSNNIKYSSDPLSDGIASDYGRAMMIERVQDEDQLIYQTERYDTTSFSYVTPPLDEGSYVLTLKFSEVWFTRPREKIFDVLLQNHIPVVKSLDIFDQVGFATAHDVNVPFSIRNGNLKVEGGESTSLADDDSLSIDFIKTPYDNPKINGIVITRGTLEDVPSLPPIPVRHTTEYESTSNHQHDDHHQESSSQETKRPPGIPKTADPYKSVDMTSSLLLPIAGSLAAFLPLAFCLCRL